MFGELLKGKENKGRKIRRENIKDIFLTSFGC